MRYRVYADLSRQLTEQERSACFEALDASVPDSGCVGLQNGQSDEVYFVLDALSETAATEQAERYLGMMLQKVPLSLEYALSVQRSD